MANMSFKKFLDENEKINLAPALFVSLGFPHPRDRKKVGEVLKGMFPTFNTNMQGSLGKDDKSKFQMNAGITDYELCPNDDCAKSEIMDDPSISPFFLVNKNQPIYKPRHPKFLMRPKDALIAMFQGNNNPLLQPPGEGAPASPMGGGGLGGLIA